jgi:hypothetical protein
MFITLTDRDPNAYDVGDVVSVVIRRRLVDCIVVDIGANSITVTPV